MPESTPSEAVIQAWARLVKAQHKVLRAVEADLNKAGFPPLAWYDVLLALRRAQGKGLRHLEIEAQLLLAQHNVSRLVDRLEKNGLVERRRAMEDGRGQLVSITSNGRDLLRRMWPTYRAAIARHVGRKLGAETQAKALAALLGQLIDENAASSS
ncbi:MAG: winged helix-turn-helix transcriptional regulator [Hyphomicrobiales bacterium]|nr:winged helix-turn-helix transcriptional regulator [Hyphomicrobiales bacterium]